MRSREANSQEMRMRKIEGIVHLDASKNQREGRDTARAQIRDTNVQQEATDLVVGGCDD